MTTTDNEAMLTHIVETQARMADSMAEMSKTMSEMQVSHARMDERMLTLLENNKVIDATISNHGVRIVSLENLTSVNKFARQFAPKMFFALIAAAGVGASAVFAVLEIAAGQ